MVWPTKSGKMVLARLQVFSTLFLPLLFIYQFGDAVWEIAGPLRLLFKVEKIETSWLTPLLQRNLMLRLKAQSEGKPLRLMLPAEMAPAAYYFGVGRIEKDQVEDYARRKGWELKTAERWLAPILNYEP